MKFIIPQKLSDIANLIGASYEGEPDFLITGMNEIHRVEPGELVFVDHPKYYKKALQSNATAILINQKVERPDGKALLFSKDPFHDFNNIVRHFQPFEQMPVNGSVHRYYVSESAAIGKGNIIQPGVVIGNHVKIGNNCVIHPNVVIYDRTEIGNNVVIHANTVVGADAFYYKKRPPEGVYEKLISCGRVIIRDNVEIGSGCTIDRGVTADTVIGKGSKLDNLVHIGHDVVVGKNCLFAAQVGIAGVVNVEDDVTIWGQVGIISDVTIGRGAVVFAQSGVSKSLDQEKIYFGSPAEEATKKMRELASIRQIPALLEKINSFFPDEV